MGLDRKMNILIVGSNYRRADHAEIVKGLLSHFDIFFLSFISKKNGQAHPLFGQAVFWSDYLSASQLLKKTKPRFVIFFNIENYNEILLNIEAKNQSIKTFIIDHGLRIYKNAEEGDKYRRNPINRVRRTLDLMIIKNYLFIIISYFGLTRIQKSFFKSYRKVRSQNSVIETHKLIKNSLRLPDEYICFSKKLFEFWKKNDDPSANKVVHYIGFPAFDKLYSAKNKVNVKIEKAIYIEQPFQEEGILGWTEELKEEMIEQMVRVCSINEIELTIKLHPLSHRELYIRLSKKLNFKLFNDNVDQNKLADYQIILGCGSTLDYPLAAIYHTVSFSLDIHPTMPSQSLTQSLELLGVSENIKSFDELSNSFKSLEQIRENQQKNKSNFIDYWLYKFDGQSHKRLLQILLKA